MYRHLDSERIVQTLEILQRRIVERFPDSGLGRVAGELLGVARQTGARIDDARRPLRGIRVLVAIGLVLLLIAVAGGVRLFLSAALHEPSLTDLLQAVDAGINEVILLGAAIYFLLSFERRVKRNRALRALHELRSLAHVIDAHQLNKDPEQFLSPRSLTTPSSPQREMTRFHLARYLDYCSELLSLTSKLAALYAQSLEDPVVLSAVNDVESLTGSLSAKVWQKINIMDTIILRLAAEKSGAVPAAAPQPAGEAGPPR